MPNGYPPDQKAMILAECDFGNDAEVAEKWGITRRTVCNYRKQLSEDPALLKLYTEKKKAFAASWVDDACQAIKIGALAYQELCKKKNPKDAMLIQAIAAGAKVFGDLNIAYTALVDSSDEPTAD